MKLNEFYIDTDMIYKEYQTQASKLLMQDIIMIYNGCYSNYNHYRNIIDKGNKKIDEIQPIDFTLTIHPKHIILDEDVYNFILSLRKLYK